MKNNTLKEVINVNMVVTCCECPLFFFCDKSFFQTPMNSTYINETFMYIKKNKNVYICMYIHVHMSVHLIVY